VSAAFAGVLDDLLGRFGLVVFDAADPAAKSIAAPLFVSEIRQPGRAAALVREAGGHLAALGHPPQVDPAPDALPLFYLDDDGRRPIKRDGERFAAGARTWTAQELEREAAERPERFSPNVVLRPIVQDQLFPTVCYVAGPNELAYLAQLGEVYRALDVERPLIVPRASATLLDGAAIKFLERADVPVIALQPQDDALLNQLLQRALPAGLDTALDTARSQAGDATRRIRELVSTLDPTLAGAVDTTHDRMEQALKNLQSKIIQAAKRKDETLRRQFARARHLAFPAGQPQERTLNLAAVLDKWGLALPERLIEILPPLPDRHYVLVI
jgi:bacillithiol biosynthesis cysteine-adding enzyme BshC